MTGTALRSPAAPTSAPGALAEGAAASLRSDGVVLLEGLIDVALLGRALAHIEGEYPDMAAEYARGHFTNAPHRFTMRRPLNGPLGDRDIFAHPVLLELAGLMLGEEFVLDSLGLLISLPGAVEQRVHRDLRLFPEVEIDRVLPAYALSVAVPLVPMDEISGTTAFFRGTHRRLDAQGDPDFAPRVAVGSVLVWDQRIQHLGLANLGTSDRPVLFLTFCRNWMSEPVPADANDYEKLLVSHADHAAYDRPLKRVMARAKFYDAPGPGEAA